MAEVVILTGMSGAGKSTALFAFEEMAYYCIENIPTPLYERLFGLINSGDARYVKSVVAVNLTETIEAITIACKQEGLHVTVVGLTATVDSLLSRYKLTRHAHPLQARGRRWVTPSKPKSSCSTRAVRCLTSSSTPPI